MFGKEPCPKCGVEHEVGPYLRWPEGGNIFVAPEDVKCNCGIVLRIMVPVFKMNEHGWLWKIKADNAPLRKEA